MSNRQERDEIKQKAEKLKAEADRLKAENTITEDNIRFVINTVLIPLLADDIDQEHHEITQVMQNIEQEKKIIHAEIFEETREDMILHDAEEEYEDRNRQLETAKSRSDNRHTELVGMDQTRLLFEYFEAKMNRDICFNHFNGMISEYDIREQHRIEFHLDKIWKTLGPHVTSNFQNPNFIAIFERNNQMELLDQLRNRYLNQE